MSEQGNTKFLLFRITCLNFQLVELKHDAQILCIFLPIIDQQLLSRVDGFEGPVVDLAQVLKGHHVLFRLVPGAVDVPHPVSSCLALAVNVVAGLSLHADLSMGKEMI